jgi:hypothetical protein
VLADCAGVAAAHYVTGVAGVALAEDHLSARKVTRNDNLGDAVKVIVT